MAIRTYSRDSERAYAIGLARAFGGALLFSLPMLMTMEMWRLAMSMDSLRLALLSGATLPLLIGLAYYLGFESAVDLGDAVLDAFVAIAVGAVLAATILVVFGVLGPDNTPREWIGRIAAQSVAASIGALLAQSQFGRVADEGEEEQRRRDGGDFAEYFFMAAGALFLCTNVAPTEEVELIAHMMTSWHSVALVLVSIGLMHAFVYAVNFKGQHARGEQETFLGEFVRFTVLGYFIALVISAFICWCIGRFDGLSLGEMLRITIVLGFPAAIGAAAARLVL